MKQAVIAPSMLSLLYPLDQDLPGYSREDFLSDLVDECEKDIRKCFEGFFHPCPYPRNLLTRYFIQLALKEFPLISPKVISPPLQFSSPTHSVSLATSTVVIILFTILSGRLALRNDPRNPWTGRNMLESFIKLNNRVFDRFSAEERKNIGVHTCPGGDCDSVHSIDVDYSEL